jgi:hypothetical protein
MKATRSLGSHFKNFKKEKQKLKIFVDYCKEGNMKQATKRMGSHFKNFKKEEQKLKGFCLVFGKRKGNI